MNAADTFRHEREAKAGAVVRAALAPKDRGRLVAWWGAVNPFEGAPKGARLIELRQQGRDVFSVRYGLQFKGGMGYTSAAAELGECIMHAAACDGLLDNGGA